jgi:glucoamylase
LPLRLGVGGYYVRVAPTSVLSGRLSPQDTLTIKNRPSDRLVPADEEISVDFLQLVRMGLRAPDDPMVRASIAVADELLKVDTLKGPAWHRYNGDGYGEHDDGSPFDGTGRGRAWPLLTGERGHYALAAGEDSMPFLEAMAAMTGPAGMMPEQVWDDEALPDLRLFPGEPTGSAMPLAWAHAEFIKLLVSRHLGYPVDRSAEVWSRYEGRRPAVQQAIWCPHAAITRMPRGAALLIALPESARVHWGIDGWQNTSDTETYDTGLSLHAARLDAKVLGGASVVDFTFQGHATGTWVGRNFRVIVDR